MSLIEYDLIDGKIDRVKIAIDRLRAFEPKEGYYLAFSGGKDSVVIKKLADMAGIKYDAHYSFVGIDPPELVHFIREEHSEVIIDKPNVTFWKQLVKSGYPTRQARWCCSLLKENGGENRFVITGIRAEESSKRANRKMIEPCYKSGSLKKYMNVIIDWTGADVWEFIKSNNIPYCKLYDEGWHRIGCLFCPNNSKRKEQTKLYPKFVKAFKRAFKKRYEYCQERNLNSATKFKSGDEMFEFWINEPMKPNPDQTIMFE